MELEDLKNRIGQPCLAVDPRSLSKKQKPAHVTGVHFDAKIINDDSDLGCCVSSVISYTVELDEVTERNYRGIITKYHRSFEVSGDRINFNIC